MRLTTRFRCSCFVMNQDRAAPKPALFSRQAWKAVLWRTWNEASRDNIGLVAAGVSFYAFLALLPLLAAIVLVYGLVADPQTVIDHVREFSAAMPIEAAKFLAEQLMYVVTTAADKKGVGLATALALSLFSARAAAGGIISALNIAYEEDEKRSFIRVNLVAIGITLGGVLFAAAGLLMASSLAFLSDIAPGAPTVGLVLTKLIGGLLSAASVGAIALFLYKFGPSRARPKLVWAMPGAILFAAIWTGLTAGFGYYVSGLGNYTATYGSLATIVIFLTWIYVASYALLLGAELNAELEHETARDSTTGPEKPIGKRKAWVADHLP